MPATAELTRLLSALTAAQTLASGADQVRITKALDKLESPWGTCPTGFLDAFDIAGIQLTRSTLRHLLDPDGSEANTEPLLGVHAWTSDDLPSLRLARQVLDALDS